MNKQSIFFILILTIILISGLSMVVCASSNDSVSGLNISDKYDSALKDAKTQNKTVMVIFDQDSCSYCDQFKQETLSNSKVQEKLNSGFVPVVVDINKDYDLASKYKVLGTPTVVFLDANEKEIHRIDGYVDANGFLDEIKGI
jgi:thioredoxin-related protein